MPAHPSRAVFLSYASEDAEAARSLCAALQANGVEVWFDQSELVGGDAWDQKIRGQIKACALFVPLISARTQLRREGYFRLEWKLAAQRTHTIADGTPFLLPVVIDATREGDALVPEEFRSVQWTRIGSADSLRAFGERVERLLRGDVAHVSSPLPRPAIEGAQDGAIRGRPASDANYSAKSKPRLRGLALLTLAVGLLTFAAYRVLQAGGKDSRPPTAAETPPAAAKPPTEFASANSADKSIAVLPFENLSDDKDNTAFFADGIHEDLLTNLANIRELRVVSRTSVMQYRGTRKPIPQIARELGVAYILEGSVRRAGTQVRITGQLIRAATD
jgi:TolB-like protein